MNPLIENELKSTKVANVPNYETTTKEIVIFKGTKNMNNISFEVGKCYQIVLNSRLTDPDDVSITLHSQWNNNVVPKDEVMNVEILEIMGDMIRVHGTGIGSMSSWAGWLPISNVKISKLL